MGFLFYAITFFLSFFICGAILLTTARKRKNGKSKTAFCLFCVFTIIFAVFNCLASAFESGDLNANPYLEYLCIPFYNTFVLLSVWMFILYARQNVGDKNKLAKIFCVISYSSALIVFIANIIMLGNPLFSYIEDGQLKYGPLNYLWYACEFGTLITIAAFEISFAFDKKEYAFRDNHITVAVSCGLSVFFGGLQVLARFVPIACFGAVLSVLFSYITYLHSSVTVDDVTRLNNKNKLLADLHERVYENENKKWGILFIRVEDLAKVNETYGYAEGDTLLATSARFIENVCEDNPMYQCYRYKNADFIIIMNDNTEKEFKTLIKLIDDQRVNHNKTTEKDYELSFIYEKTTCLKDTQDDVQGMIKRVLLPVQSLKEKVVEERRK